MKTSIDEIDRIIDAYERYAESVEMLSTRLKELQLSDPVYVPYSLGVDWSELRESIAKAAQEHAQLRMVYTGSSSFKLVGNTLIDIPLFYDLQDGFHVLINPYNSMNPAEVEGAEQTLYQYLMFVLLSYPVGTVHVNFIDPYFSGKGDSFMNELGVQGDSSICSIMQSEQEVEEFIGRMKTRLAEANRMGDRYYMEHPRYELVILLDYPRGYERLTNSMELLLEKGEKYGIQFVVMNDTNPKYKLRDSYAIDILSMSHMFTQVDANVEQPANAAVRKHYATDLFFNQEAYEQCMSYLKEGMNKANSLPVDIEGFTPLPEIDESVSPEQYFADLKDVVAKNVVVPVLKYSTYQPLNNGKYDVQQNLMKWQVEDNAQKNIVISFRGRSKDRAEDILNELALNMMLSLPVPKAHFTIVNPKGVASATFLNSRISDSLVDEITEENKAQTFYNTLLNKMTEDRNKLGCGIERYNVENQSILRPYEVIILISPEAANREEVINLFDNGSNNGIYFIVMADMDRVEMEGNTRNVLSHTFAYQTIDADADYYIGIPSSIVAKANRFSRDLLWRDAAIKYINKNSVVTVKYDWDAAVAAPYPENSPKMSAVIGYEQGTGEPVEYKIDIKNNHYHAFVIGGTGSGKTSFLHSIILGMSVKYKPEDVEIYLLDLKGPEFGRYKQLLQAGAVLVDKSDDRITYEVIASIERKMNDRKERIVGDLEKYNQTHKDAPLPQIVLIIDECQNLFKTNTENPDIAKKIINIITLIATEGRAFGVHLLMATQSLANCPMLDFGVLHQFQDFFILPCNDADAKMLVSEEHKERVGQEAARMEREKEVNKGQCFLQGTDGYKRFKFNFVSDNKQSIEELSDVERLIQKCVEKAADHPSNGQVFFSGRQNYSLYNNIDCLNTHGENYIIASAGQNISFAQDPQTMRLLHEPGQNILTIGYDDKQFVSRTSMNILLSLILSSRQNNLGYHFAIINCLGVEAKAYSTLLQKMAETGYCELIEPAQSGKYLKSLCDDIASDNASPTVLVILRQEAYTALKNDAALITENEEPAKGASGTDDVLSAPMPDSDDISAALAMMNSMVFEMPQDENMVSSDVKTYREALLYILSKGPEKSVFTLMQINKSSEFALTKSMGLYKEDVTKLFSHIVFSQVDSDTNSFFGMYDVNLHEMEESENRLRAYYFNANGGSAQLISPYVITTKKVPIKGKENLFPKEYVSTLNVEAIINELNKNY